jgi:uncharacterized protein (DUF305 family)
MDIQSASVNMAQNRVLEEAAVRVQALANETIRNQAAELARLMDSAKVITDMMKGNYLNVLM